MHFFESVMKHGRIVGPKYDAKFAILSDRRHLEKKWRPKSVFSV